MGSSRRRRTPRVQASAAPAALQLDPRQQMLASTAPSPQAPYEALRPNSAQGDAGRNFSRGHATAGAAGRIAGFNRTTGGLAGRRRCDRSLLFGKKQKRRAVYRLVEARKLPVFTLGGVLCARRDTLLDHLAALDGAAIAEVELAALDDTALAESKESSAA